MRLALVHILGGDGKGQTCTGTAIGGPWILTAAHCVIWEEGRNLRSTAEAQQRLGHRSGTDLDILVAGRGNYQAHAYPQVAGGNYKTFDVNRIIVHRDYRITDTSIVSDLALLQLSADVETAKVTPARLASPGDDLRKLTMAGYGYTHAEDSQPGTNLRVAWPATPTTDQGFLSIVFRTSNAGTGRFCPGDSGGPAFTGRHRGCPTYLAPKIAQEAPRPRPLAGVISYLAETRTQKEINDGVPLSGERCTSTSLNRLMDVTNPANHRWICDRTNNMALGCR
ncbi:trypsin-like serine protease [Teichococcus aestuarii]|uniref:trypsin-like serine protease n=1 Tax=Teichococcus aestuarii TaxID=568898 RepID=UPI003615BC2F